MEWLVDAANVKIKSREHYEQLGYDENPISNVTVAGKDPGSWGNGLRVGIIDAKADQILTLDSTTSLSIGIGVTQSVVGKSVPTNDGLTKNLDGYLKGIVTELDETNKKIGVKVLTHVSAAGTETSVDYVEGGSYKFDDASIDFPNAGGGTTSITATRGSLGSTAAEHSVGAAMTAYSLESSLTLDMTGGTSLADDGTVIGIATAGIEIGSSRYLQIENEIISLDSATIGVGQITLSGGASRGVEGTSASVHADGSAVKYLEQFEGVATVESVSGYSSVLSTETAIGITTTRTGLSTIFTASGFVNIGSEYVSVSSLAIGGSTVTRTASGGVDWFDQQTLTVDTVSTGAGSVDKTVSWNQIADRPSTTTYGDSRGARFDEVHVVVVDGDGKISGNAGTILEKHLGLSKAKDAEFSAGSPSYWRKYLKDNSSYIFGGSEPIGVVTTGFTSGVGFVKVTDGDWDQNASGITFDGIGALNSKLSKGLDYGGATGIGTTGLEASISKLSSGYELLENGDTYAVDFLLMGSAGYAKKDAQALAQKVIAVANVRKDAVAFISPYRGAAITGSSTDTAVQIKSDADITTNVLSFYAPLTSTSYAVFDSGYKYMYDRFNDTFRYVPLNGDIAGTCARTDANAFPWFSPAGTERGAILNAVKLAYNPSKAQRDRLYSARVNPVIFSPGAGIVLFGDKTGLAKASAFDRINVRRLFIYLEDAIQAAARDQLFEFNDEITRTNFVNIVEPFLRDVQAKRGIQDYVVICDETNNTAAIIDNNEFVADIYIKPARSINFIGLTFVATRTGVSFEEVVGNV